MNPGRDDRHRRCIELWDRHAGRLLLYASALLADRSVAEDVLQGVFARLWERGQLPDPGFEAAYLFQAVRNEALNARRTRTREGRRVLLEPASEDPRERAELAELARRIEAALRTLPPDEQEAIALRVWGELSGPDAAGVAGVSEKALEHRYYRGLAALKEILGVAHE
jgi:RNA polymerase sigma-70 factor (ECF subfamily)